MLAILSGQCWHTQGTEGVGIIAALLPWHTDDVALSCGGTAYFTTFSSFHIGVCHQERAGKKSSSNRGNSDPG